MLNKLSKRKTLLLLLKLFYNNKSILDYVASMEELVNNEMKRLERKWPCYSAIYLEGLGRTTKILTKNSRCPDGDSNQYL